MLQLLEISGVQDMPKIYTCDAAWHKGPDVRSLPLKGSSSELHSPTSQLAYTSQRSAHPQISSLLLGLTGRLRTHSRVALM